MTLGANAHADVPDRLKAALAFRYEIEREIGAGGMVTVFLAEDLKHRRNVAVKVLRPELAAALGPERFLREIEIAARLDHPHILPLFDSGDADGFLYYVMPFVEGESLREKLTREKQLPIDEALIIAREVADGLSYAHSRDRAAEFYARALMLDSTSSLYYSNLSGSLEQAGLSDSAARVVDRFERRFPDNPEVAIARILAAASQKRYDDAEQLGNALLDEQRGRVFWEAIAYFWMGNLSAMRGQMTRAQRAWDRSLALTAERYLSGSYLNRAALLAVVERLLLDDPATARRVVADALVRYPLESLSPLDRPYTDLAFSYAVAGVPERAREMIAQFDATADADHSRDNERDRHGALGIAALAEGRLETAVEELWQWDDGNLCYTCAYPWLARAYDQLGVPDSALSLFERFVEIPSASVGYDAGHLAFAYVRVGELYEQRGERERAIEYYGRFVDLWKNADSQFQPRVEEARQAIARLSAEPRR